MAGMHGDEPGPSRILYQLRDGRPIKGADIWVIPVYNPDGRARHTRQNAHGVDLNRNWPYHWAHLGGATYSGPRAASEPETRAVMAFLKAVRPRLRRQLPPAPARRRPRRAQGPLVRPAPHRAACTCP